MKPHNRNRWKSKIDPCFDKLIKFYIDSLSQLENSSREGRLNFPDDFIKPIIEKSGWQDAYKVEDIETHKDMFGYLNKTGILHKIDINLIFSAINAFENPEEILKICSEMIKALPQKESQQFYLKKIQFFKGHPELKPTSSDVQKDNIDFYSMILSLFVRYLFEKVYQDGSEIVNDEIEYFKTSNAVISLLGVILSIFSQIANQMTLTELKDRISRGDDKAVFKAVTIDKSFLYMEEVKNRINHAQLSGDNVFFSKLGRAIASNPLKSPAQHGKTYAVLNLFWLMGLYKLTNEELYEFLKSCGLIPPAYPDAFQKFVRRHIKSVYNF